MTPEKQEQIYQKMHGDIMKITASKREDYAGIDVLQNFKSVSKAAKALNIDIGKPEQYALFMVLLKIARITNLLNGNKTPNNEAIDDSFLDGINYFKLAYCNYIDEKER